MKRIPVMCILVAGITASLFSESLSIELAGALTAATADSYLDGGFSDAASATLLADGEFYDIDVNLSMANDGRIEPHSPYQLGHYFYTEEAMARIFSGDVSFSAGRGRHADIVDTPYAIYINPDADPALHAEAAYRGDLFSYTSRWVRLNARSAQLYNGVYDIDNDGNQDTLRDRGMTFKTYALDFGKLKIGFEDVSLYLDRSFDAESFLSPFPMYFLEMLTTTAADPGRR